MMKAFFEIKLDAEYKDCQGCLDLKSYLNQETITIDYKPQVKPSSD